MARLVSANRKARRYADPTLAAALASEWLRRFPHRDGGRLLAMGGGFAVSERKLMQPQEGQLRSRVCGTGAA
jgi:hypothetical protein